MPDFVLGPNITYDTLSVTRSYFSQKLTSNHSVESSGAVTLKAIKFKNKDTLLINGQPPGSSTIVSANTQGPVEVTQPTGLLGEVRIESEVYLWSDDTADPALKISANNVTVTNNGYIMGKGGDGGGNAGGPAIEIASGVTDTTVINNSGAYIAGGGGGGGYRSFTVSGNPATCGSGGGAGGGDGTSATFTNSGAGLSVFAFGGNGGSIGNSGANAANYRYFSPNGNTQTDILSRGIGGGAGGGGGNGTTGNSTSSGGGGGGRILPGTGGATSGGAAGGSAGNAGANGGGVDGGGGGGWGASGGSGSSAGGAGGAAVSDNGAAYTLTNNGTVYGVT